VAVSSAGMAKPSFQKGGAFLGRFVILLAAPRTGTTALGDAVTRAFAAGWPQEIFNEAYADGDIDYRAASEIKYRTNFFNFRRDLFADDANRSFPSTDNLQFIFDSYLTYISSVFDDRNILLDIKYTSWHHLNGFWNYIGSEPELLKIVRGREIPIVHLTRQNLFSQYCSSVVAQKTGIWATQDMPSVSSNNSDVGKIVINPAQCAAMMARVAGNRDLFENWLRGYDIQNLVYEEMLTGSGFSSRVGEVFARAFAAQPIEAPTTMYRKVTPPLRDVIANREEVLAYFNETVYRPMVEEALG